MIWVLFVWTGEDRMQGVGGGRGRRHGVGLVAALVMVAGCTDGSGGGGGTPSSSTSSTTATIPAASTPASPSPTTSLSAKDQAAAEARAAYLNYRRTVDRVFNSGGAKGEAQLKTVATGGQLAFLVRQAQALRRDRVHQAGEVEIKRLSVRQASLPAGKAPQVFFDACIDTSKRKFVDSRGRPTLPGDRQTTYTILAVLTRLDDQWLVTNDVSTPARSC